MSKTYQNNYNTIKVIALFLVVFSHCTKMYAGTGVITFPIDPSQKWLTDYLYVFHNAVFMFASGAIYKICINAGKYGDLKKYVVTKFKRLMVPYLLVGLIFVSPTIAALHLTERSFIGFYIHGILLMKDKKHLWFLLVLFIYSIGIRILKPLFEKSELFAVAAFLVAIPLNLISGGFAPLFFGVYFMLGYLFETYEILPKIVEKTWYLFPLCFILVGLNWRVISPIAGIAGCYQLAHKFGYLFTERKWFKHLSKNSMGIYLLDPMMIYVMYYWIRNMSVNPWIASIVIFIIACVLSDLLTEICRKAKLKVLIGE